MPKKDSAMVLIVAIKEQDKSSVTTQLTALSVDFSYMFWIESVHQFNRKHTGMMISP